VRADGFGALIRIGLVRPVTGSARINAAVIVTSFISKPRVKTRFWALQPELVTH
jgi:hypothetical protein